MVNMSHVKWYAEKLYELLLQDPNCRTTVNLAHEVELFLHISGIESLQAEAPPGIAGTLWKSSSEGI